MASSTGGEEEARRDPVLEPSERAWPCSTLPPEGESRFVLFPATLFVVLG